MIKMQLVLSLLEVRVSRNVNICFKTLKKITYSKLLCTNGKLAPKFGVGAPKFWCAEVFNRMSYFQSLKLIFADISGTF